MSENNNVVKKLEVYALATDPIYIGTGGYNIGRVDNTIVRDPINNVPKIPGSSLAGTWRYYVGLEALKDIRDKLPQWENIKNENGNTIGEKLENYNWKNVTSSNNTSSSWKYFVGNQIMKITCAGQDNVPQEELENSPFKTNNDGKTGHCGHCIVCKGFGFSKKDISWQGMLFFSDLNILFFPVFTYRGTKWITTQSILNNLNKEDKNKNNDNQQVSKNNDKYNEQICIVFEDSKENDKSRHGHINLGWLYLPYKFENNNEIKNKLNVILKNIPNKLNLQDVIIVPEDLFSQIVNSNLEVRTSVSIDPITGAAKEGALFTSEAIPRGTIFYGNIRIFDKKGFKDIKENLKPIPEADEIENALNDSKHFYETLGIGGMTKEDLAD